MLDWIQTLLVGFCTLLAFLLYRKKTYKGPPHVTGVPILGYMPFVGNEMYLTFQEIMKKRGPIFSLYLGSIYTVVLGTYDVIHEAYVTKGNVFNSRPSYLIFKIFDNETAFAVTDGEEWKVTRNFTMNALKKLGFGKTHSQSYLQAEISSLLLEIRKYEGRPLNLEHVLEHSIDSLILSIFTGLQREYNDPWQKKIIETATELMKTYVYDVMGMFPWMKKIPFLSNFTVRKKIRILKKKYWDLWDEEIVRQKECFSSNSCLESFIHEWLAEQQRRNQTNDIHKHLFSDFNLKNNLDILLQASADTTSVTISWGIVFLITNPDIQTKVFEEINEIIGKERFPCLEDAINLNYTRAFIMEVHRRGSIGPFGVFHSNNESNEIRGFYIPKDSMIINNLYSIHHDPKYFPDPYRFYPERFLDEKGKLKPCEYLIPFSIGRRTCPGRSVAEMQTFLYLTSILQAYELKASPGSNISENNAKCDNGLIRRPASFEALYIPRKK